MAKKTQSKGAKQKTLEDLYIEELRDVFDAEKQLVKALPKMAKAVQSETLRQGIQQHLEETKEQVTRLESLFADVGVAARGKTCEAMKGLIKEGEGALEDFDKGPVRDAAIIAGSQRIEHYEIAAYGTLCAFAEQLGKEEAVELLQLTLDEEKACDEKLNEVALSEVNPAAHGEAGEDGESMDDQDEDDDEDAVDEDADDEDEEDDEDDEEDEEDEER